MKPWITYLLRLLSFWLLLFLVFRIIMLGAYADLLPDAGASAWLPSLFHGLPLDLSAACALIVPPLLLGWMRHLLPVPRFQSLLKHLSNAWVLLTMAFVVVLQAGELSIYGEWRSKATARYIYYLGEAMEGLRSAEWRHIVLLVMGVLMLGLCYGIYRRWLRAPQEVPVWHIKGAASATAWALVLAPCTALGIRGSVGAIGISPSSACYSQHAFLNDVAMNSPWFFLTSVTEEWRNGEENRYHTMPTQLSDGIVRRLFTYSQDSTPSILTQARPNILVILQEGMSADMVGALGGNGAFSKNYDALARESLVFDRLYSAGWCSEVGHFSVFSAFPALIVANPVIEPEKYRHQPSVVQALVAAGYDVAYYHGGRSNYGNIRGYMYDSGCRQVMDESDYPDDPARGRLGFHDAYMADRVAEALPRDTLPWCRIWFTLSTHPPFDIPGSVGLDYHGEAEPYARAAYYADSALGRLVERMKADGKWENTLVLIIPDHSRNSVVKRRDMDRDRYRIGWLVGGGALRPDFRGQRIHKMGSQLDVAATILPQLGLDASRFCWSKNLLSPACPEFASYVYPSGHAWMRPRGNFIYDFQRSTIYEEDFPEPAVRDTIIWEGMAYIQAAQEAYLRLGRKAGAE